MSKVESLWMARTLVWAALSGCGGSGTDEDVDGAPPMAVDGGLRASTDTGAGPTDAAPGHADDSTAGEAGDAGLDTSVHDASDGDAQVLDAAPEAAPDQEEGSACAGGWLDPTTQLCWQNPQAPGELDWEEATAFCESLEAGGTTEWRLPNVDEARSLLRGCPQTQTGGACPVAAGSGGDDLTDPCHADGCYTPCFCSDPPSCDRQPSPLVGTCQWSHWTSTLVASHDNAAWFVSYFSGAINWDTVDLKLLTRCVRDGH